MLVLPDQVAHFNITTWLGLFKVAFKSRNVFEKSLRSPRMSLNIFIGVIVFVSEILAMSNRGNNQSRNKFNLKIQAVPQLDPIPDKQTATDETE